MGIKQVVFFPHEPVADTGGWKAKSVEGVNLQNDGNSSFSTYMPLHGYPIMRPPLTATDFYAVFAQETVAICVTSFTTAQQFLKK
ncbi:hypothetical protein Y032_0036g3264 [Ancylostoma ceylanicum]|uniref:Uncharacterized protein n=1 Tax=Ancylostoma ceylanicum TaxID=53326 RepID=A0A016UL64_9BILA|nr:hypothetical protein Y032_0036g3264 [Ancylostoma ceylanicum]